MNFGPLTASKWTTILPTPVNAVFYFIIGFADGHQQTELKQTLPSGGRWSAL